MLDEGGFEGAFDGDGTGCECCLYIALLHMAPHEDVAGALFLQLRRGGIKCGCNGEDGLALLPCDGEG